ncbi:nucleotidyltransferase domain-containing protein [Arcicella rigui]|uniref:Cyclic GMP-AMP synthase n=1 Tax=Arcicella rigui TaxID=797020 RepID=A0ABU5QAU2_9BACT|nr:nucleotidyltransferase [Arcicella rigui]MEA5139971.1 nucleotidyltransferase [Arcicella rigui]
MLTEEQKKEFNEILTELGSSLDISETQFNTAVASYNAVGGWLTKDDSLLKPYNPKVLPQGSIIIGTTIKPINKDDDMDLDLVCQLSGKAPYWTQKNVKDIVGQQIEKHKTYESLMDEEGRRCWTLKYRTSSKNDDKYHMDILPAIISKDYEIILEKSLSSSFSQENVDSLAIRITDTELLNYSWETNPENWLKSNPFGYAQWFLNRAELNIQKSILLSESLKPVPKYQTNKLPLQRAVQILKRHRDMMFKGNKDKPISVIITTLSGYAYNKETNVLDSLYSIIESMENYIETKYDSKTGKYYKHIANPVNPEENFADKWVEYPEKEVNFYKWLNAVRRDIKDASQLKGKFRIQESLSKSFGDDVVNTTFINLGNNTRILTEQGSNRFDTKVGITALGANTIKPHNFYGNNE